MTAISIEVSGLQAAALAETLRTLAAVKAEAIDLATEAMTHDSDALKELSGHHEELEAIQALLAQLHGCGAAARVTGSWLLLTEIVASAVVAALEVIAELSGHVSDGTLELDELLARFDAARGLMVVLGELRASEPPDGQALPSTIPRLA